MKIWSSTRFVVALSSGEAERYGLARGASIGLGSKPRFGDFGLSLGLELNYEASAGCGIASRMGLELGQTHASEPVLDLLPKENIQFHKVPGDSNLTHILTNMYPMRGFSST